ncbi:hypothetical protein LOZ66_006394 [Ophidiomyces ophidiicola]|nr:hypothetical protein LOZ66_006394 [Ophidiomyces ophidiicola]
MSSSVWDEKSLEAGSTLTTIIEELAGNAVPSDERVLELEGWLENTDQSAAALAEAPDLIQKLIINCGEAHRQLQDHATTGPVQRLMADVQLTIGKAALASLKWIHISWELTEVELEQLLGKDGFQHCVVVPLGYGRSNVGVWAGDFDQLKEKFRDRMQDPLNKESPLVRICGVEGARRRIAAQRSIAVQNWAKISVL